MWYLTVKGPKQTQLIYLCGHKAQQLHLRFRVSSVYTAVSSVILSRHLGLVTGSDTQARLFSPSAACALSEVQDVLLNERRRVRAWLCWCLIHRVSLGGPTLTNRPIQLRRSCSERRDHRLTGNNRPWCRRAICYILSDDNHVNLSGTFKWTLKWTCAVLNNYYDVSI